MPLYDAVTATPNAIDYTGHTVLRIHPQTVDEVTLLREELPVALRVDWWKEPSYPGTHVDARFAPGDLTEALAMLERAGIEAETFVEDVQETMDATFSPSEGKVLSATGDFALDKYHTLDEVTAWMNTLEDTYGSVLDIELVDVGSSFENRTITAVKFTGKSAGTANADKPGVWLDGGIHAREWISPAVNIYMLDTLLADYGSDEETTKLVDEVQWYILPVFNVDGYVYTQTDRMWRKTRSTTSSRLCVGVDPNRNWDWHWGEAGASTNPCSDGYQGPNAFSEIEVKSVTDYIKSQSNINGYINFHSYSQLWMSPWGYTSDKPDDFDAQNKVSEAAVAALKAVHGTSYDYGPISTTIYPASGSSADWTYGECGVLYSYGVELRDTGKDGFVLPEDQIVPSGEETLAAVKVLAHAVAGDSV